MCFYLWDSDLLLESFKQRDIIFALTISIHLGLLIPLKEPKKKEEQNI